MPRKNTIPKEYLTVELRRIAQELGQDYLTRSQYDAHRRIDCSGSLIETRFDSWSAAVREAGLSPDARQRIMQARKVAREDLLRNLYSVYLLIGKKNPTQKELRKHGKYSTGPYRHERMLGKNLDSALREAIVLCEGADGVAPTSILRSESSPRRTTARGALEKLGQVLDFRGYRYGPVNENGVLALFSAVLPDLGLFVERIGDAHPDCICLRSMPDQTLRRVRVEIEYRSSNYRRHGHNQQDCDIIVCWIHDWPECDLEIIDLREWVGRLSRGPKLGEPYADAT